MRFSGKIASLCLLLALLAGPAWPQVSGSISGSVLDISAARVPAADVRLTSTDTGYSRTQKADSAGRFRFAQLPVGSYLITADGPGFRATTAPATVRSGQVTDVTLHLEPGMVRESISVSDAETAVDSVTPQLQSSFDAGQVVALPALRNPVQLATLAPGVVPVTANNPYLSNASFNVHGGRGRANNITVDEIVSSDVVITGVGGNQLSVLNFEQIKEVKLITHNFSAEFGRNSSSQLQFTTKSGSNQFHGSAFEFVQNDFFNARDFFDSTGKATVTRANDYGFTLGGPLQSNRTHFFLAFEQNPVRGSGTVRVAQVPTAAMVAQVTDPASKKLLDAYQLPTSASGQIAQSGSDAQDAWQFSARLDHQLSARDSLTARYARYTLSGTASSLGFIGTNLAGYGTTFVNDPVNGNISETHLFSPTLVNQARFAFGRVSPYFTPQASYLGPRVYINNGAVDSFGESESYPQGRTENTFQFSDTVTWTRGAHNYKAGADLYRYQANSNSDASTRGVYRFSTWEDFAAGRPASWSQRFGSTYRGHRVTTASFFLGDDWRINRRLTLTLGLRTEVAGPVSEVNHLTSNLDLGCTTAMGSAGTGPLGCLTTGQTATNRHTNWAPRLGFAWTPFADHRTVVRGGYGMAYDFLYLNPITNQRALMPYIYSGSLSGTAAFTGANSWASFVAGTAQAQLDGQAAVGNINSSAKNFGTLSPIIDPALRNPQTQQWSLSLEHAAGGVVFSAAYAGSKSNYLQRMRAINLINDPRAIAATSLADEAARLTSLRAAYSASNGTASTPSNRIDGRFNDVNLLDSSANSNYHALELSARRAFSHGYSLQASSTFSKSIDDVSDALGGTLINDSSGQQNPRNNRDNRAVSQFDIPQRFVVAHVWELPFGRGLANPVLRRLATGWSFSGISSWRSGFPVTLDAGSRLGVGPLTLTGMTGGPVRPNAAGPVNFAPQPAGSALAPTGLNADPVQRISAYAAALGLSQPLLGNYGSLGRNSLRLNAAPGFDWSVAKATPVNERVTLQLRAEAYNVFNQSVFQDVSRSLTSAAFGQYTTTAMNSRNLMLGLRVIF